MVSRTAATVADGAAGREFAKGTIVGLAYAMRLALFELVRRAQDAGAPAERRDCWLVTREELPTFVEQPSTLGDIIAERRERRELLQSRIPPFVFQGSIPDPHTWARRDEAHRVARATTGTRLTGMGVSPGVARGRVRVVHDPSDPGLLEPGDVLVAPVTDPAWTPLFLVADAVVCDVGARLSHAAIVARELGIPAVVSVADATRRLADGATVSVDGTEGTVTVIDAGGS
jgi:rifampicin phosphotransferase